MAEPFRNNAEHLAAEMRWLNLLLSRAVLEWREQSGGSHPDVLKGLYLSDREIDYLLQPSPPAAEQAVESLRAEAASTRIQIDARMEASRNEGIPLAFPQLAQLFGLTPFELQTVAAALAPELDLKYEKVFAYLQDDLSRKRLSADLAIRLLPAATAQDRIYARLVFSAQAPLFRFGMFRPPAEMDSPLLSRPLTLDELTIEFLLGTGNVSRSMAAWLRPMTTRRPVDSLRWPASMKQGLAQVLRDYALRDYAPRHGPPARRLIVHFSGPDGSGKKTLAGSLCRGIETPLLVADVRELAHRSPNPEESLRDCFRQGIFQQSALFLEHFDCLLGEEERLAAALRTLRGTIDQFSWVTFVSTARPWTPGRLFADHTFLSVELTPPDASARERLWSGIASDAGIVTESAPWATLATRFRLTPGEIEAALKYARSMSLLRGPAAKVTTDDLVRACYAQSNQRLGHLARKLRLNKTWADLTVPGNTQAQLEELCNQVRHRRLVYEDWEFDRRLSLGKGLCALFYGASGVGKTMAVEIVAQELKLEAYKIDLSTVVSKYIGETEKNLSRIFDEAETSNAILFFDEADALFGKRSEVKDAHDRYANIEINYLLQRVEEFDGLVILASNMRRNIDEGFFRRMQFAIEFPMPETAHRYRIWKQHIPDVAPLGRDVDFEFLAHRFPVAGGNIKNIVLNAAFLAARSSSEIRMEHMIRATRREYQKIGRVCTDAEFAPYQSLLREV